ncbi:MAG TPA: RNA-binding cell elongation regulator Jag/EloR [Thermotogota bacterium]|nr:RNA-binding cell elongation regulator Jag/EloR [Thermotogota bacterium]HPJ88135.1 RNA-binding cell elongation regulator Jag/EloR [Thermotogota bacterium]HPR95567.1 RNA-binding cell elongation regulator Jag/EloR [Thermotogota bacterium]
MKEFEITGKTVDAALTDAEEKWGLTDNEYDYEVLDPGSKGFLKIGSRDATIKINMKTDFFARKVRDYISDILHFSNGSDNNDVNITYRTKNSKIFINLSGEHLGRIIGKHGKTISALQHISNIYVNRITDIKVVVYIEVGDYKDRRKEIIQKIAIQNAKRAKMTNKRIQLDPMFAFERRIVHEAIKGVKGVKSYSKGLEPYRYVVIEPYRSYSNSSNKDFRRGKDEQGESNHVERSYT